MCDRMRQVIRLVAVIVECDENPLVMGSRCNANPCTSKVDTDLIEASGRNTLFWAFDVVGGDRRVMGSLFGEI